MSLSRAVSCIVQEWKKIMAFMGGYRAGRIEYHSSQALSRDQNTNFDLVYVFVVYQLNVVNQV